jgi:hypothetical protein
MMPQLHWLMQSDAGLAIRLAITRGIHLGGYVGGLFGSIIAAWRILHLRRKIAESHPRA